MVCDQCHVCLCARVIHTRISTRLFTCAVYCLLAYMAHSPLNSYGQLGTEANMHEACSGSNSVSNPGVWWHVDRLPIPAGVLAGVLVVVHQHIRQARALVDPASEGKPDHEGNRTNANAPPRPKDCLTLPSSNSGCMQQHGCLLDFLAIHRVGEQTLQSVPLP